MLTEAHAMVVREYLVENCGFDDSQHKALGMGKQEESPSKPIRSQPGQGAVAQAPKAQH